MPIEELRELFGDADVIAMEQIVEIDPCEEVASTLADLEDERWFAIEHESVDDDTPDGNARRDEPLS